nr:MAG TPA: hypothetical protein [Caudoviricetes sp.]
MKENIDLFFNKLIHKIFPEFSNKITWTLITAGLGIIALPAPTYILFINLFIDFYNEKTNSKVKIIDIDSITPSTNIAIALIASGLIYHLIIKSFQIYLEIVKENRDNKTKERKRLSDINLYESFIKIIPPQSTSIDLLKNHDFGNSYHENSIKDFEKLSYQWGYAHQHFHDNEIENKVTELSNEIKEFNYFLAFHSNYLHSGPMLSMLTNRDRAMDMEWSPQTEKIVQEANEKGSFIYKIYCDFVLTCKKKLAI